MGMWVFSLENQQHTTCNLSSERQDLQDNIMRHPFWTLTISHNARHPIDQAKKKKNKNLSNKKKTLTSEAKTRLIWKPNLPKIQQQTQLKMKNEKTQKWNFDDDPLFKIAERNKRKWRIPGMKDWSEGH